MDNGNTFLNLKDIKDLAFKSIEGDFEKLVSWLLFDYLGIRGLDLVEDLDIFL